MIKSTYATVINEDGYRIDFILVNNSDTLDPFKYIMPPNTSLVFEDWVTANEMAAPRWDGEKWIETNPPPEAKENESVVWNFDKSIWEIIPLPEISPDPMLQRITQLEEAIVGLTSVLAASGAVRLSDMPVQLMSQIQGLAGQQHLLNYPKGLK